MKIKPTKRNIDQKHGRNLQPVLEILIILIFLQAANSSFSSPLDMEPSWALNIRAFTNYKSINSIIGNKGNLVMVLSIAKLGPSQISSTEILLRWILQRNLPH